MKDKITDFLATKDSGKFFPLNKLIIAVRNPTTREQVVRIKKDLQKLVDEGVIEIEENRHQSLDIIDSTVYSDANGNAQPRRYLGLEDLRIAARGKGERVVVPYKPIATPSPNLPQREETFVEEPAGAKRADYRQPNKTE